MKPSTAYVVLMIGDEAESGITTLRNSDLDGEPITVDARAKPAKTKRCK